MICGNCKSNVSDDILYCSNCGENLIGSDMQFTRNEQTQKPNNNKIPDFKNGENFGERYKIVSELGKGGMGQVFKAHDKVLGIDVALKMIRPEFIMNKKMISRFKQEILLAREITHENVSRIYDFGEVDGVKFISMEFISGRTLKDIIKKGGPVEVEKAIKISEAICSGLEAAHKKGIIHRDLKPQNIMIDETGHVYITDFGLAKSVREENIGRNGLVIGTPQYIPPELWKGEVADERSDIYSLGIIMYEMVSGKELFKTESDYGYLQKHNNEVPEFPSVLKDKLPSFLKQLILKCLAKERDARYKDCGEIYRDLKDRLYSTGTFLNDFERSIKKTGPVKIGISFLLILIISFIGSFILKKGTPVQKKRSVAILYFKNLSGIKDLDHLSFSLPELLKTDLGQSKYIKVIPEEKISEILKRTDYLGSAIINEKIFRDLGTEAEVNYLVEGSFIRSGTDLRLIVKLRDSDSGEILSTDYVDTSVNSIFPAIDSLTTELKKRFNLTENEIFADIDSEIESITTSSKEALDHYITGKRLFNEGKYKDSIDEYRKAVEIDPEFAMAYRNTAWSYVYLNNWEKRKEYFEKTIRHVNKLSIREKYLIYGDYYGEKEITYQRSIDSYKKILDIYPNDYEANFHLGVFCRLFEDWDLGIRYLRKALNEDKSSIYALSDLVLCYGRKGEFKRAEELIKKYRDENGEINSDMIFSLYYLINLRQGKFDAASEIVDQRNRLAIKENSGKKFNKGEIHILRGKFDKAEKVLNDLKKNPDSYKYPGIEKLKYLYLHQGRFNDYEKLLKKQISNASFLGWENQYKTELFYFYLGSGLYKKASLMYSGNNIEMQKGFPIDEFIFRSLRTHSELGKGNLKRSETLIKKLKDSLKDTVFEKLSNRLLCQVMGKYYKMKGSFKKAEDYYLKSMEYLGKLDDGFSAPYFYNTAIFYYDNKKYEEAEKLLKHIHELSFGRLHRGDLYAKSFYYLGKIYQKKKRTGKAIESYEKFINIWKDGDPEYIGKYIKDTGEQLKLLKTDI